MGSVAVGSSNVHIFSEVCPFSCSHQNSLFFAAFPAMASSLNTLKPLKPFIASLHKPVTPQPTNLMMHPQQPKINEPKLIITGTSSLSGHVTISGSKNSSLPILAATLCCSATSKLQNLPNISDVKAMMAILSSLGAKLEVNKNEVLVNTDDIGSVEPDLDEVRKTRGGFFVIGPLLARFGEAIVPLPGGCDIGLRPVDLYVRGLEALGAVVEVRDGKVLARTANGRGLVGGRFRLDYPSVGATETLMMAASMADGITVLSNIAKEPEVIDLAQFLNSSGACIEGAGSDNLIIKGKCHLHGSEFVIPPDRIEAGTFLLAAAITRSCISISPVIPSRISCLVDKLSIAGCKIRKYKDCIMEVSAVPANIGFDLQAFDVKTSPFPGFPTDLQPQTMALLSTCRGLSVVEESVFENRMGHVRELKKLGARIQVYGRTALIYGKDKGSSIGQSISSMTRAEQ